MGQQKTFSVSPEQSKYFSDIDNSILKFSVELGRAVLQVDSVKGTLSTLYQSRQKQMLSVLEGVGLDPTTVAAFKIAPDGTLVVDLHDGPPQDGPPA